MVQLNLIYDSPFLNVFFSVLCGLSVLVISKGVFAIKVGEIPELDDNWKQTSQLLKIDSQIQLLKKSEGKTEDKITSLRKTDILDNINCLKEFLDVPYEPATSYVSNIADQLASWVFSPHEKETQYTNFFNKIVTDPSFIQDYGGHVSQLVSSFDELKNKDNPSVNFRTEEEKDPIFNQDNNWTSLCQTFLENYTNEPEVAEYALNQLHILAETSKDVKDWLQESEEVLKFVISKENHKNQPVINPEEYRKSPFRKVEIHKDYATLRDQLKPLQDELKKLQQNADVHLIDNFVKGNEQKLTNIAHAIFPENGNLKLEQVKKNLKNLIVEREDLLKEYKYETKSFTKNEEMFNYIDKTYEGAMPNELCSYVCELGIQILNSPFEPSTFGIYRIFDAIVENYQTGGGCLAGRKNRQFGALVSMLSFCGLDEQPKYK